MPYFRYLSMPRDTNIKSSKPIKYDFLSLLCRSNDRTGLKAEILASDFYSYATGFTSVKYQKTIPL
jgi:hypothetical protein